MYEKTQQLIKEHDARWVDLRFTDPRGKAQHTTIPASRATDEALSSGIMFDGSSIAGWKSIHESDMMLVPDDRSAVLDPFFEQDTVILRCDVIEPTSMTPYNRDPRAIAKAAEGYLQKLGIGDVAYFGPEAEFFVFDAVRFEVGMSKVAYEIESEEAAWSSGKNYEEGNLGHRPSVKGGYFPVPPIDSMADLRADMCSTMMQMGLEVEVHHHEVGTAGQGEIGVKYNSLVLKADELQTYKYVVQNVAATWGKTATFMPKPLMDDNGNGMHVHQSIWKDGENMFLGKEYAGLSKTALHYIGGIMKHARALNAFTNATTNSYKRLVPGFEAPTLLAYSARNRSASIRIPFIQGSPKGRRIEVRFPDSSGNPYLAFASMLMAGIDGIVNEIDPGDPLEADYYSLSDGELKGIPTVAPSLRDAIEALDNDRAFLTAGGVFTDDAIDGYIDLKKDEVARLMQATHPIEFQMYYSV